jgi:D-alanyl-D-alanine carboxypeptidase
MRQHFVDGDDVLALVNRAPNGGLSPAYAPRDLVSLHNHAPATARECDSKFACLRKEAADALKQLLAAMGHAGHSGHVASAYRSYQSQCGTFLNWTKEPEATFCGVAEQSAIPGHSQHQLGTTIDLFTDAWVKEDGGAFRDGFGCTAAGKWLRDHGWEHGFVQSYPIHPDDVSERDACRTRSDLPTPINPKTGYKHEAWHVRYIGSEHATQFHEAWKKTQGTADELTLEQWIRTKKGMDLEADLPMCDGCSCGACASVAATDAGRGLHCRESSLRMDGETGTFVEPSARPHLLGATVQRGKKRNILLVRVTLEAPAHALTQPPVVARASAPLSSKSTYTSYEPHRRHAHAYTDLPRAWRLVLEPAKSERHTWPWRVSIADSRVRFTYNRVNTYLPVRAGKFEIEVPLATVDLGLRVALYRQGEVHDEREVSLPPP